MTMTIWQGAITIVTVVLGTMCTRFLPFLVFGGKKEVPGYITYLSGVLPYAIMGMLVVYCLMIVGFGAKAGMFPLHIWLPKAHPVAPAPASATMRTSTSGA